MPERFFTPPQAAKLIGVGPEKVLAWIHSGELTATNVAVDADGERPRWRISEDDLAKFLFRRQHPSTHPDATPKRRRRTTGVVEHF